MSSSNILKRHLPEEKLKKKAYDRRHKLMRDWGITLEEWEDLFDKQGRCCAICGSEKHRGLNWHIDHDHETGIYRGILCGTCNRGLGYMQDSVKVLKLAIKYLEEVDFG